MCVRVLKVVSIHSSQYKKLFVQHSLYMHINLLINLYHPILVQPMLVRLLKFIYFKDSKIFRLDEFKNRDSIPMQVFLT